MGSSPSKRQSQSEANEQSACKPHACAIQKCLAAHDHDERRCADVIEAYDQCVRERYGKSLASGERSKRAKGAQ